MHVPRLRDLRWFRQSHMSVLHLSENIVARALSILRILSKRPLSGLCNKHIQMR